MRTAGHKSIRRFCSGQVLLFAAVFALFGSVAGFADDGDWSGTYSIQVENDRIAQTDRHYTNGLRLSWISDKKSDGPMWVRDTLQFLYPLADIRSGRIGAAIGQNIYTPEDTNAVALVADDRPYAGWLYGAASIHAETTRKFGQWALDSLDSVELSLGIVGPQAYAEETQNNWHDLIGVSRSNGWDNQLKNEPAVALFFQRKWRPEPVSIGMFEIDAIPHAGGSLGNVFTLANLGATLRFGQQLGLDYGPPQIRPSLSGLTAVEEADGLGWYFFVGGEGRAVLRNIFLDGNSFADSHSVDKKSFVGNFQLGLSLTYSGYRLAFSHVFLSKEFDEQRRSDRYGTLTLSKRF